MCLKVLRGTRRGHWTPVPVVRGCVSHLMWVLGTELKSTANAVKVFLTTEPRSLWLLKLSPFKIGLGKNVLPSVLEPEFCRLRKTRYYFGSRFACLYGLRDQVIQ